MRRFLLDTGIAALHLDRKRGVFERAAVEFLGLLFQLVAGEDEIAFELFVRLDDEGDVMQHFLLHVAKLASHMQVFHPATDLCELLIARADIARELLGVLQNLQQRFESRLAFALGHFRLIVRGHLLGDVIAHPQADQHTGKHEQDDKR